MYWERPTAPRMFSPTALIMKYPHKDERQRCSSTAVLMTETTNFERKLDCQRAETVSNRTSKRAKALCFKVRRNY